MIENIDQLRALYGEPGQRSMLKQLPRLEAHGQRFIERSRLRMSGITNTRRWSICFWR